MGRFDKLMSSYCCCSCGICCSKDKLCNNCSKATLQANGIDLKHLPSIIGLNRVWSGNRRFQYSELYNKLKELKDVHIP